MKTPKPVYDKQQQVLSYIREYGITAAIEGTGLPLCDIRRCYMDEAPVTDHLERVYQVYRGVEHEQSLYE